MTPEKTEDALAPVQAAESRVDAHFQATLLAAVGQAIIATDPAGAVLFWNQAAEFMFGWTSAEAVGRSILELTPSSNSAEQAQHILAELGAGSSWSGDFHVRRRDGSEFSAFVTDTPVFGKGGELVAVIGVSTDITERKAAEDNALALAMIVESTSDAIFTVDVDGAVLTWNRGAEALYGYGPAEIIGRHVSLLDTFGDQSATTLLISTVVGGASSRELQAVHEHQAGESIEVSMTLSPLSSAAGEGVAVIARDITDQQRLERELTHLATHDPLTGLPNRVLLEDRLIHALIGSSRRDRDNAVAVMIVDLDRFKTINDTSGHHVGDRLLVLVANRLRAEVRATDTVARLGGDEFVIVCEDTDVDQARLIADRLAATFRDPFDIDGQRLVVSSSIGIAVTPPLPSDNANLLRAADAAMYAAKSRGRAQWQMFDDTEAGRFGRPVVDHDSVA